MVLDNIENVEEDYLLYADLCFIPSEFDDENVVVGNTTRSVCRKLCSGAYSLICSAFLYDRVAHSCKLTPFTGELLHGSAVSIMRRGCEDSTFEFYRRKRLLCKN